MNHIASWKEIIETANNFSKIIVTGNQRSGTTYAAYAIAKELNYEHIDEMRFKAHNDSLFRQILNNNNIVVQAPAMLHKLPEMDISDCLVIFMTRDSTDIIKSMKRIGWINREAPREYLKFSKEPLTDINQLIDAKNDFINRITHLKLPYNELQNTPGFIQDRNNFAEKQII